MGIQRDLDVHVLDHNKGVPRKLSCAISAGRYHTDPTSLERLAPDILIECTGALAGYSRLPRLDRACRDRLSHRRHRAGQDRSTSIIGGFNRTMVLGNDVVFGTVNANRRHYELAADALAAPTKRGSARLITRRVPLERWSEAFELRHGDIKVIIEFAQ